MKRIVFPVLTIPVIISLGFVLSGVFIFSKYIQVSVPHILALIILPLLISKKQNVSKSLWVFIPAILCFAISAWLGVKSILFLGYICSLIALLPYLGLSGGMVLFFGILLFSPIWNWFDLNISFSLRLMLTDWAGHILKIANTGYTIEGNWIKGPQGEFSVEKACAGLNMLKYALLGGLLILSLHAKSLHKDIRKTAPFSFLGIIFILSLFSNLCRILFLVIIPLAPETLGHEIIGLLYIGLMVLLPAYLMLKKFPHFFLTEKKFTAENNNPQRYYVMPILLLCVFIFSGFVTLSHQQKTNITPALLNRWNGFDYQGTIKGVHKFTKPHFLIWIKPLDGFYSAEHSPLGCWSGSGFTFKETKLGQIYGEFYPQGILESESDTLYTAWWFESESVKTGDALGWRKESLLRNEDFNLVNITSDDPKKLEEAIQELWK